MKFEPKKIAIQPLGAHEQHGPHLPFETDSIIASGIIDTFKNKISPHLDITFLPTETIGYSPEHLWKKGSKSLTYHEAIERWIDIGRQCQDNGIGKILFLNAHGGNSPLLTIVITELRIRFSMLAVATHWGRFGLPEGLISETEKALDIHAGFIETSLMLALAPEHVQMAQAENFYNQQADFIEKFQYLRAYGPHAFGWQMNDLNNDGAVGKAAQANAQAGKAILAHTSDGIIGLLDDMAAFDQTIFNHKNEGGN